MGFEFGMMREVQQLSHTAKLPCESRKHYNQKKKGHIPGAYSIYPSPAPLATPKVLQPVLDPAIPLWPYQAAPTA